MPTTYKTGDKKVVLVRRISTGIKSAGSPPPKVGQIWPRGNRGAT